MEFKEIIHPVTGLKQVWPVGATGKPRLVLSGSNQSTEASCSNLFRLQRMFQNPKRGNGHAADCGTALHNAHQKYLLTGDMDEATVQLMLDYPIKTDGNNNARTRQFEACYATLAAMCLNKEWPADYPAMEVMHIKKKNGDIIPAVEINFEIFVEQDIIEEFDVYISGALDQIMRSQTGLRREPVITDTKTTREKILWFEKFQFASQTLPYHLLLSHLLGEDVTNFTVMYHMAYIDLVDPKVQWIAYQKDKSDIEEYFKSFVLLLNKLNAQIKMNHWPKNPYSCVRFKNACSYVNACKVRRGMDNHDIVQDIILGNAEPYDRYADPDREIDFSLRIAL